MTDVWQWRPESTDLRINTGALSLRVRGSHRDGKRQSESHLEDRISCAKHLSRFDIHSSTDTLLPTHSAKGCAGVGTDTWITGCE